MEPLKFQTGDLTFDKTNKCFCLIINNYKSDVGIRCYEYFSFARNRLERTTAYSAHVFMELPSDIPNW